MNNQSQADIILHQLKQGKTLTAKDAIQFGCFRLAARVKDLREHGVNITTIKEKNANGSYHARYSLAKEL
jgi:hypothetical protein